MKKLFLTIILAAIALAGMSQNIGEAFYIYRNDGQFNAFFRDEVQSIEYSYEDADGVVYDEIVTQIVTTADSVYKIPLAAIDSIGFVQPETAYEENTIVLSSSILNYIISVDSLTIYLRIDTPEELIPIVGQKLAQLDFSDLFPDGFVGEVNSIVKEEGRISVVCSSLPIDDVVTQFCGVYRLTAIHEPELNRCRVRRAAGETIYERTLPVGIIPIHVSLSWLEDIWKDRKFLDGLKYGGKGDLSIDICPVFDIKVTYYKNDLLGIIPRYNAHMVTNLDITEELQLMGTLEGEKKYPWKLPFGLEKLKDFPIVPGTVTFYLDAGFKVSGSGDLGIGAIFHQTATHVLDVNFYPIPNFIGLMPTMQIPITTVAHKLNMTGHDEDYVYVVGNFEAKIGPYLEFGFGFINHKVAKVGAEFDGGLKFNGNIKFNTFDWQTAENNTDFYNGCVEDSKLTSDLYIGSYGIVAAFDERLKFSIGDDIDLPNLFHKESSLLPSFSNVKLVHQTGNSSTLNASAKVLNNCVFPLQLGFALFKDEVMIGSKNFEGGKYWVQNSFPPYSVSFEDVSAEGKYMAYPTISLFGKNILASPSAEISKANAANISVFKQTKATYSKSAFTNDGKNYDFSYNTAITVELETGDGVDDWGYVYEDPDHEIKHISLKGKESPYTDTNYAFYRNEPIATATLYGYVKYIGDDNYYYGEKKDYDLIYDKQPKAETLDPTEVDETSAKVKCAYHEAAPWGGTCGIEYWEDTNVKDAKRIYFETASDEIEIPINLLKPNTVYYYQALIKVDKKYVGLAGIEKEDVYSDEIKTFTTKPHVVISSSDAINVKTTSATLTGTVEGYDPADESIKFAFMYSNESDLANSSNGVTVPAQYDGNGNLTAEISGLSDYTTYYYALAIKRGDAAYETSEVKSFKTLPVVTTLENPTVTDNSVALHGMCSRGITTAGFSIKKKGETAYTQYGAVPDENGNFSATIDGLDALTAYSYFAFVKADNQIYPGKEYSFSTPQPPVSYYTGKATEVNVTTATLNGTVNYYDPNDESVKFKFFYHTDENIFNGKSVEVTYDGNVSMTANVSDLKDYTTYYYALAIKRGDAEYISHNVESFNTLPVVTTLNNATSTSNSATLYGTCSKGISIAGFSVKKDGDTEYTQYGAVPDEDGNFSATVDGLESSTTYHYYAFIRDGEQSYLGEEYSFTTKERLVAITLGLDEIDDTKAYVKCNYIKPQDEYVWCGVEYWDETMEQPIMKERYFFNTEEEAIVLISNLKPKTKYYYRALISDGNEYIRADETRSFTTLNPLCPDDNHPHMIDLGLPSGTKWACCNVGADNPEGFGGYYAWGETEEKSRYDTNNYLLTYIDEKGGIWRDPDTGNYFSIIDIGSDIAGTEYDVATVKWGSGWTMPSRQQIMELREYCEAAWGRGRRTMKFIGSNGNFIILPDAGNKTSSGTVTSFNGMGFYWSSSASLDDETYHQWAFILRFDHRPQIDKINMDSDRYNRSMGFSVRPVHK